MSKRPGAWLACLLALGTACTRTPRPEDKIASFIESLKDPDPAVSGAASRQLIDIGEPAVPALAETLKHSEPRVRIAAASTIWGLGPRARQAVPALAEALADGEVSVRLSVAMTLDSVGHEAGEAVPALITALRDSDANVRLWSAKALGKVGPPARAAIPALREAARHDMLRSAAEESLRQIQGPPGR